ncbi:MAG: conjugal transfer protein TraF, partial [Novosphingobium sp.]|nr:conjugal transfer protein TraF [Novosphingobium sp.]
MIQARTVPIAASLALSLLVPAGAHAASGDGIEVEQAQDTFYCGERKLGTWFYCEDPRPEPGSPESARQVPARERLAAISTALEELKARAILEPTPENVTAYVRFQREQL